MILICLGYYNKISQTDFNNRNLFSHSSGGKKSKIKASENLIYSDVSIPD
jgi:hypothetical protein